MAVLVYILLRSGLCGEEMFLTAVIENMIR